jgi:hypothetical protein
MELAADSNFTSDPTNLARLVTHYQAIAATGCRSILLPDLTQALSSSSPYVKPASNLGPTDIQRLNEATLLAAFALIMGNMLVSVPFFYPQQQWFNWPGLFGAPVGQIVQNGLKLSRDFAGWTVTADFETRQMMMRMRKVNPYIGDYQAQGEISGISI